VALADDEEVAEGDAVRDAVRDADAELDIDRVRVLDGALVEDGDELEAGPIAGGPLTINFLIPFFMLWVVPALAPVAACAVAA